MQAIHSLFYWLVIAPIHFLGTVIFIVVGGTLMLIGQLWPILLASLAIGALMGWATL